jgi:hypothetical protein
VRAALTHHGIAIPAAGLTRWQRIEALRDPAERARAARRVEVEGSAEAKRAMQVRIRAERATRRAERPV